MIKNYLKIAWRNLRRHKLYSLIIIGGLAVGLCVCMLIMLYVSYELSYDRFHANAKRIYALDERAVLNGNVLQYANTNYVTGPLIQQHTTAVEGFMRLYCPNVDMVLFNPVTPGIKFSENGVVFADATFFTFFSFKLLSGNAAQVLSKPNGMVITRNMAKKYFGDENPVGKTLKTSTNLIFEVTGIADNAPSNSSINFDFIASNEFFKQFGNSGFSQSQTVGFGEFKTYLLLKRPADTGAVQTSMLSLIKQDKQAGDAKLLLTALPDIHLNSIYGSNDRSNTRYIKIFPMVAGIILLLALINYISLATARATLRAKEVGVRKVNGAGRRVIALQFFIESALYISLSFVLAYVFCYFLKDPFLNVLQLKIDSSFLYSPLFISIMAMLLAVTIIAAGSYPAFVLSAFDPIVTLKGKMSRQAGGKTVRKIFTTLQFAIAVGLIICGIIINRQLYYFRHMDTGVNRENVVMIPIGPAFGQHYQSFKSEVQSIAGISTVATARYQLYRGFDYLMVAGKDKNDGVAVFTELIDKNLIPLLNIKWSIPPINTTVATLPHKIIVNEAAVSKMGLPANPVGRIINGAIPYEIAGVIKNFNDGALQMPIGFFVAADTASAWGQQGGYMYARIKSNTNVPLVMEAIKKYYKKYEAGSVFSYDFLDDVYNKQYKAEDRLASIFSIFTIVTIVLASSGLFGLATFTIEQRNKEIGIRKVMGASISTITSLLSIDFLKLVVLSIIIASPVAWWAMHSWLQNFVFRIAIGWWTFLLAGGVAILIALFTVSLQSIRAAMANPVDSLKSE